MQGNVLSIDVGIKNLSYCVLNSKGEILDWKNVAVLEEDCNCKNIKLEYLVEKFLETLMQYFDECFKVESVIIENQPMLKNGLMKTLSVVIYTYFNMMKMQYGWIQHVNFISANNKLKCKKMMEPASKNYKERKNQSIVLTKVYLEVVPEKLEWLNMQKKKDDLCDAFLAGIYFLGL
jgi:hypothetical protein